MTTAEKTEYRLGSSDMVGAPGVIAWAKNGYAFKKDQPQLLNVVTATWGISDEVGHALLSGEVEYTVEDGTVVFSV